MADCRFSQSVGVNELAPAALEFLASSIPMVVLSANSSSPAQMKEHESLTRLSSQAKHVVASKGGHWIQLDEPDLVIESIREVVESVGRRRPQ